VAIESRVIHFVEFEGEHHRKSRNDSVGLRVLLAIGKEIRIRLSVSEALLIHALESDVCYKANQGHNACKYSMGPGSIDKAQYPLEDGRQEL